MQSFVKRPKLSRSVVSWERKIHMTVIKSLCLVLSKRERAVVTNRNADF